LRRKLSDTHFEADLLSVLAAQTLLIMDRFYHFQFWAQLIEQVSFICRLKAGASYTVERVFTDCSQVKDQLIKLELSVRMSITTTFDPSPLRLHLV